MTRLETTVAMLDEMIAFPTVSSDSNRDLISWMAERVESAGARVRVIESEDGTKANLFASFGPEGDGGIVLSGHTDVVPAEETGWATDPFTQKEADGLLYGRGTCDMKGFLACVMASLPDLAASDRPIHIAATYDEEVGCIGGRQLVEVLRTEGLRPRLALIGEPTSMRVIEGHKGCCEYSTSFHGLEGHGSQPDLGVSAVEYAARFINRLLELRGELRDRAPAGSPFDPPWTTLQVGRIEGGVAHNVIAGLARVDWELRPVTDDDHVCAVRAARDYCNDVLLPAMRAVHPGAEIVTETIGEVRGLELVDDNEAAALIASLTGVNEADVVSFGTEAGLFQSLGCDAVVCGPGDIAQAHKANEYVEIAQLDACLDLLAAIARHPG
ncbi:acetylornithine deacetylase [Palleronia marisminoris]|uniref:Acetylornithine deacetylase n=1 Tax=Palleronia marisminoris TaxID=315423 RepID=A0A1Y5RM10_9RHOB|nr:acetylornithine deacetylase [Palleronia marisminoris]SFG27224.1 acetylornithine deacetylase [Palleronia marisminoris]SLN20600.1 Acetylornithine deacetylase [Palleronia marisminoris]